VLDCILLDVLELTGDELLALDMVPPFTLDEMLELEKALDELVLDGMLMLELRLTVLELDIGKDDALDAMLELDVAIALLLDLLLPFPEEPPPHAVSVVIKMQEINVVNV
jgi:hypothetical protein